MPKSLEDMLRGLAKHGELTYISVLSNGKGFEATYSPASYWGHGFAVSDDPVMAIQAAIKNFRKPGYVEPDSETDPEVAALLS